MLMNTGRLLMNITLVVDARKLTGEVPGKVPSRLNTASMHTVV